MMSCRRDHPRVCGEKPSASLITSVVAGSPPRMRGKAEIAAGTSRTVRITPAYAGKRSTSPTMTRHIWDHPRVCGEKSPDSSCNISSTGSPPRMRGKDSFQRWDTRRIGITPAYAGKSSRPCRRKSKTRDHPRVCGEKEQRWDARQPERGSPPRMRGKARGYTLPASTLGITPAYAGKSSPGCQSR